MVIPSGDIATATMLIALAHISIDVIGAIKTFTRYYYPVILIFYCPLGHFGITLVITIFLNTISKQALRDMEYSYSEFFRRNYYQNRVS